MHNYEKPITLIRSGKEGEIEEGVRILVTDQKLSKIAVHYYNRYKRILFPENWEDLFYEAISRLVVTIQKEKAPIRNLRAYFRGICRNTCEEKKREKDKTDKALEILKKIIQVPANEVILEKVKAALKELGGQCEILLRHYYLEEPTVQSHPKLAALLNRQGYQVSTGSISAILSRCKMRFRELLGHDPSSLFED